MIPQKPFKYVCPKCGYSKIVKPKSDVLNDEEMLPFCPKCETVMERKALSTFDNIINIFK